MKNIIRNLTISSALVMGSASLAIAEEPLLPQSSEMGAEALSATATDPSDTRIYINSETGQAVRVSRDGKNIEMVDPSANQPSTNSLDNTASFYPRGHGGWGHGGRGGWGRGGWGRGGWGHGGWGHRGWGHRGWWGRGRWWRGGYWGASPCYPYYAPNPYYCYE